MPRMATYHAGTFLEGAVTGGVRATKASVCFGMTGAPVQPGATAVASGPIHGSTVFASLILSEKYGRCRQQRHRPRNEKLPELLPHYNKLTFSPSHQNPGLLTAHLLNAQETKGSYGESAHCHVKDDVFLTRGGVTPKATEAVAPHWSYPRITTFGFFTRELSQPIGQLTSVEWLEPTPGVLNGISRTNSRRQ